MRAGQRPYDGLRSHLLAFGPLSFLTTLSKFDFHRTAHRGRLTSNWGSKFKAHRGRERRGITWSVDVGIANAISKPGLSQASSAGQAFCSCADQHWGPTGFILREHSPIRARQPIG